MYSVTDTTINMTRGDTVVLQVEIQRNGEPYELQEGDEVRFALKHSTLNSKKTEFQDANPLVKKTIGSDLVLTIEPSDTKKLGFGNYTYDIQITFADGTVDTFIDNASLVLLPEVD